MRLQFPDQLAKHVPALKLFIAVHAALVGWFSVFTHFRNVPFGLSNLVETFLEVIILALPVTALLVVAHYVLRAFDVSPRWRVLGLMVPPTILLLTVLHFEELHQVDAWRYVLNYLGYAVVPVLISAGVYEWFTRDEKADRAVNESRREFLMALGGAFVAGVPVSSLAMHEPTVTVKWHTETGVEHERRLREGEMDGVSILDFPVNFVFDYQGQPVIQPVSYNLDPLGSAEKPEVDRVVWGYDGEEFDGLSEIIGGGYWLRANDELRMRIEYVNGEFDYVEFWAEDVPRREEEEWEDDED